MNSKMPHTVVSPCYSCVHRTWWMSNFRCTKVRINMDDDFTYMSYCSFYSSKKPKTTNEEDETDTSDDRSTDSGEE